MNIVDNRKDQSVPPSDRMKVLAQVITMRNKKHPDAYLKFCDAIPKDEVPDHIQLNFEPEWIDDEYKALWRRNHGRVLHSRLLEDIYWVAYRWGIWETDAIPEHERLTAALVRYTQLNYGEEALAHLSERLMHSPSVIQLWMRGRHLPHPLICNGLAEEIESLMPADRTI